MVLADGAVITVTGQLDENARIGVTTEKTPTMDAPVVITGGLQGNGDATNFVSDDDRYTVRINDTTGGAELVPAPATAPTITGQPADVSLTYGYAAGGAFTVTATGADGHELSYQWYKNSENSTQGALKIENAVSAAYTVPTDKTAGTEEYYYCVVTATRTDNGQTAAATSGLADFNAATGLSVSEDMLKYVGRDGTAYAESSTAPVNAGKYTAALTVEGKTATVDYEIARADPAYTVPEGLTAGYGDTLSAVSLADYPNWTWMDGSVSVGNAGAKTFPATFTPDDTANYNVAENVEVPVTVRKAPLTITAKDQSMYAGYPLPAWGENSYTVTGLLNGDTLEIEPAVEYKQNDAAVQVDANRAGEYEIWPQNAKADNYEIAYAQGTLTISYMPSDDTGTGTPTPTQSPTPTVTVPPTQNGSVEVEPTNPAPGQTATVRLKLEEGYVADWITVTDKDGNKVKVTKNADGAFSFTEPEGGAVVMGEFMKEIDNPFEDVNTGDYFYDPVIWAFIEGVTNGTGEDAFSPDAPCQRAHIITFLYRAYHI